MKINDIKQRELIQRLNDIDCGIKFRIHDPFGRDYRERLINIRTLTLDIHPSWSPSGKIDIAIKGCLPWKAYGDDIEEWCFAKGYTFKLEKIPDVSLAIVKLLIEINKDAAK